MTHFKQGVALTGRNTTGRGVSAARPPACPAHPLAALQMTTTTDASEQNNTGPLGRPVTTTKK